MALQCKHGGLQLFGEAQVVRGHSPETINLVNEVGR